MYYIKDFFFLQIHTKKRNRLDVNRLNSLVYVQFNAKLFNKQRRVKEKNIDVILDDRDERNAEEWFVETSEGDGDSNGEPVNQAPNDEFEEDHESEKEDDIAIDIEFESDNEQVVNDDVLGEEDV